MKTSGHPAFPGFFSLKMPVKKECNFGYLQLDWISLGILSAPPVVVTAEIMGNKIKRIYDVGVAVIHRLFYHLEIINKARAVIVVAGMESSLVSIVGGLTDRPIIAVPTSVCYGANFGGISALLRMLISCAAGISVVNIDNGFGIACMASKINQLSVSK